MREIIFHQIGHCGNQIGLNFWEYIAAEHSIDWNGYYQGYSNIQLERICVYFNEIGCGKYKPRAIISDLKPGAIQNIRNSPYGRIFSPESFICGTGGAGNNWARGYYTEGAGIMDEILEKTRTEAERCDCLQGFQIVHSTGGGTGAGMGSLLFSKLKEEYPDRVIHSCSVIPSPMVSETVVESYNSVLSVKDLTNYTDETFFVDNEALYALCRKNLGIPQPGYCDLNNLISHAMAGVTTCFRFPGQLNTDLRKLYTNMVPYPNLHFFIPVFAPLTPCNKVNYKQITVPELIVELFEPKNLMVACFPNDGKYLACAAVFRGRMSTKLVDEHMAQMAQKHASNFASFLPKHFKTAICDIPPRGFNISATFIMNSTAIRGVFKRMLDNFTLMLRRRAFVHWYTGEGMDETEFKDAEEFLIEVIKEYDLI